MSLNFWKYIDEAVLDTEIKRSVRPASKIPSVWPSEASATALQGGESGILGKCHRASYLRMTNVPITNETAVEGAWRWIGGRLIETHISDMAKHSKIFVASGCRTIVKSIFLPLEMDLIVLDPETYDGSIIECKTYYGYMAKKDIEVNGHPKVANLMQVCLYLNEFPTGSILKDTIRTSLSDKLSGADKRNRIEVDENNLDKMNDGPLTAKLVYISRDECLRKEFTISIEQDFDGLHYPVVDGQMYRTFNIESLYERYKILQKYWFAAREAAVTHLSNKGIVKPESLNLVSGPEDQIENKELTQEESDYLNRLEQEVRNLPDMYLPPAEYEWAYSAEKVEKLYSIGEIGKLKYNDWKKKKIGKDRIGSWSCSYCSYKRLCIPRQNANMASHFYDVDNLMLDE
jgi:hypothetical protein